MLIRYIILLLTEALMSLLKISQVSTCNTKHNALLFPICLATAYTIADAKIQRIFISIEVFKCGKLYKS